MREERTRILELLQQGKISVEEAGQLLDALGREPGRAAGEGEEAGEGRRRPRRLTVRITDLRTGKVKTDVRLPYGAWGVLAKLTQTKLGRRMGSTVFHDIQRAAKAGSRGHIVDLSNEERGERIEIFFD